MANDFIPSSQYKNRRIVPMPRLAKTLPKACLKLQRAIKNVFSTPRFKLNGALNSIDPVHDPLHLMMSWVMPSIIQSTVSKPRASMTWTSWECFQAWAYRRMMQRTVPMSSHECSPLHQWGLPIAVTGDTGSRDITWLYQRQLQKMYMYKNIFKKGRKGG